MRKLAAAPAVFLILASASWAAAPDGSTSASLATFRVTAAEVHVTFTAVRERNQPVTNLAPKDFTLLRDGRPVQQIVGFRRYQRESVSAMVLTDVSDSMEKALPLERAASQWLQSSANPSVDRIAFANFGLEVESGNAKVHNRTMTSLYDALMETLPRIAPSGSGIQALILLSDGIDNDSFHGLDDVITLAQRRNVAIYAITAHPGKKQYYRPDLLRKLCEETGGKYYDVRKTDAMLTAMADINDELRNGYEVIFSPGPDAGLHELTIQPNDRHMRFYYRTAYYQPAPITEMASAR